LTTAGQELERLYLRTPSLEFRRALNLAVNLLNQSNGPALAVVSSPFYAVELLRRCLRPLDLAGAGQFDPPTWISIAQDWAWSSLAPASLSNMGGYSAMLWAEPDGGAAADVASTLCQSALPGAHLAVVVSSGLRRFLPAWQAKPYPANDPLSPGAVERVLRSAGWVLENRTGFHSPRAVLWSLAHRLLQPIGRPDLADRCLFNMRAVYDEKGWLWWAAPLALITARRS
jgi:hypothetical protein